MTETHERYRAMSRKARERVASMADYPDSPERAAELLAITEALMPGQLRAILEDEPTAPSSPVLSSGADEREEP